MSPIFEGSLINNTELRDNLTRTKCMVIPIGPKGLIKWKIKNTYVPGLFDKLSSFRKNKLKETPI